MITLAIETSCDETAVCLLETLGGNPPDSTTYPYTILGNIIHSQVELHRQYGGVFPAMAKREHSKNLLPLLEALIKESNIDMIDCPPKNTDSGTFLNFLKEKESELFENFLKSPFLSKKPASINQIAVTRGPGLEPALWVGVNCARALSILWDIPLVGINHMEGHILGSLLDSTEINKKQVLRAVAFPALALLVSGGHTELVLVKKIGDYEMIGRTKDDAVGEAYDKVARMLGLPYPGGIEIQNRAEKARAAAKKINISLPRPMIHSHNLDFSFSGLKTAVLYTLRGDKSGGSSETPAMTVSDDMRAAIACEFENAVTDVLIAKTQKALEKYPAQSLILGGGVSANKYIRSAFEKLATQNSIPLYLPPAGVSGDNALMIALAAAVSPQSKPLTEDTLRAHGNLSL